MKYKKIVLAGGNGYLGSVLTAYFKPITEEIIILSRRHRAQKENVKTIVWDGKTAGDWKDYLGAADMLINLCGKNVNCRYTKKNQEEIISSRITPTKLIGTIIETMENPPKLWINITSATIYRHAEDRPQDEDTGEIGYGFSIDVCRQWEDVFFKATTPDTRKVALRMGIVFGKQDAAFPRLLNLVKCGLGGKQGDGQQYVSWVHEQDAARSIDWIMQHDGLAGIINCTAPEPVKNEILMSTLRKAYGVPFGLPSPAWMLELGAWLIGTETELILKSRWVVPQRLLASGYTFLFPKVEHAVKDILSMSL
ncbi:MAG TPA: TIGR01777 family oxidoreductase [Pseudosphingobacterium sp.]|nr:TIGR01777 family oxidoreductase [Pseudosphingobacterium sp.]